MTVRDASAWRYVRAEHGSGRRTATPVDVARFTTHSREEAIGLFKAWWYGGEKPKHIRFAELLLHDKLVLCAGDPTGMPVGYMQQFYDAAKNATLHPELW